MLDKPAIPAIQHNRIRALTLSLKSPRKFNCIPECITSRSCFCLLFIFERPRFISAHSSGTSGQVIGE